VTPRVRLTRRGRLLSRALPLFLVLATAVNVLVHRAGDGPDTVAAGSAPGSVAATSAPAGTRPPSATPRPSPTVRPSVPASPSPKPSVSPRPTRGTYPSTGDLVVAAGSSAVHGTGRVRRFIVEVEQGLAISPEAFAASVEAVLFDPRGWAAEMAFQRVSSGPVAFRVTLASPRTTDRMCRPLDTGGIYSCWNGARAMLNAMRWFDGAASYTGDLASYRIYMVNHEVGHGLGHGHRRSCGAGGLAPVMMQQTKSLYGCRRNPWPLAAER
jgi:hypothetical protein